MAQRYNTITQRVRAPRERNAPYQKRSGYYKRQFRKTTKFGYTRTGSRLFRRNVKRMVENMAESKYDEDLVYFDENSNIADKSIYREGRLVSFCGQIAQNIGSFGSRIGNRITLTSLQMKLVISPFAQMAGDIGSLLNTTFFLRCIIFTWRDDSEPTLPELFSDYSTGPPITTFEMILTPLNHELKVKRKILYDETTSHYLNLNPGGFFFASENPVCFKEIYIPIKKLREVYYSNESTPEEIGVNKIYCYLLSNVSDPVYGNPGVGKSWPVYLYWRINYKDL